MNILKRICFSNALLYKLVIKLKKIRTHISVKCRIDNRGYARLDKDINGNNNSIQIGMGTIIHKAHVHIRGNSNKLIIENKCYIGEGCSFWLEGNNTIIRIGKGTTVTYGVHFCAQENNSKIILGDDCMLSNTITIRTSDSHPIYEMETKRRMNEASDVLIGNHVWVAPNVRIMKGVNIGEGTVIGTDTIVTKNIPTNSLAVGHPAKVVKSGIEWTRDRLF